MTQQFRPAGRLWPLPAFKWHIVVSRGEVLCAPGGPLHRELPEGLTLQGRGDFRSHYLGDWQGEPCGVHHLSDPIGIPGCEWRGLRRLLGAVEESLFFTLGRATQVADWDLDHQYCGRCGLQTEYHPQDRARVCTHCSFAVYPRISPCVIMLITRGDECLLARHNRHKQALHTALAGFIEPGENAEQALVREVFEEVGLEVGQVRYLGSQSWPFPGQLMIGFFAEAVGGALALDREEILDAHWFHRSAVPETIPPRETLSGQLIRTFVAGK
ncbi:NAD(+) diphosphatase [Microbulbifer bruguierae]|uniref:NAD(+) diphosphatase n=1 Tax=Microbulbifer bruguierae TaxID=3029061 RepID=A0ABY8NFY9_9GAMM|nr:NAD(+) diphosphatase [Microbulbifer bruguierae]WGL17360.1 NAD(+) diphosphatase [Microbulbifer bruguierae]